MKINQPQDSIFKINIFQICIIKIIEKDITYNKIISYNFFRNYVYVIIPLT